MHSASGERLPRVAVNASGWSLRRTLIATPQFNTWEDCDKHKVGCGRQGRVETARKQDRNELIIIGCLINCSDVYDSGANSERFIWCKCLLSTGHAFHPHTHT